MLSSWSEWSQCSETCGSGQRVRYRSCSEFGMCGDASLKETEDCELQV